MKIGFLINHDQIHQIAHSLPIAVAMRKLAPEVDIVVATTHPKLTAEVRRLLQAMDVEVPVVELGLKAAVTRLVADRLEWLVPARKIAVYRDNLDFFRALDVLVVAEKTSLILRTRYGLDHLRIVHTRHGAGDRAIGFDKASRGFDQVMVSGPKIRDRLVADAGLDPAKLSMVGYAKFDLVPDSVPRLPMQDNGRPTVFYNPHPSPHLSSWYLHGRQVLEFFRRSDRYNLIFAPHVMLFHRRFVVTIDKLRIDRPGQIDQAILDAPNIHVDLGSSASTDMSYTLAADIYLGDVSSQIYEFLYRPRPTVFLNSHNAAWQEDANYAHWKSGPVIPDAVNLGAALDWAVKTHDRYRPIQRSMFERSFDLTDEPSAMRAARAILEGARQPVALVPELQRDSELAA